MIIQESDFELQLNTTLFCGFVISHYVYLITQMFEIFSSAFYQMGKLSSCIESEIHPKCGWPAGPRSNTRKHMMMTYLFVLF